MKQSKASIKTHLLMLIKQHRVENPIKSYQIKAKLGISSVKIREIVNELRADDNLPICSDSTGYFYARNKAEALHTINQLRSRAKHIHRAAEGVLSYFEEENQLQLL